MLLPLYSPLAQSEIRLFYLPPKIHRAAIVNKDFLSGNLKTVDLEDAPPYVALSYVWGSDANRQPFVLNDHEISITENLALALEQIQDEVHELALWVDALCINQSDVEEKSAQVLRMRDIYAAAEYTLVWLGPSAELSDLIMDSIEAQSRKYIDMGEQPTTLKGSVGMINTARSFIERNPEVMGLYSQPSFRKLVVGHQDLLSREWWRRTWVLQEFVVAKDVYLQCGSKRAKLDAFEFVLTMVGPLFTAQSNVMASTRDWLQLKTEMEAFSKVPTYTAADEMFIARHQYKGYGPRLADLLFKFNRRTFLDIRLKATDPKDKVYGLLGLASDFESLGITPNYAQSVEDVYTEAATKILAKGDLIYLQLCKYDPHSALPSWVPDLRQDISVSPNEAGCTNKPFCAGFMPQWTGFPRALQSNPRVLAVEACRIGSVKEIGDVLNRTEDDPIPSLQICHCFIVQIDVFLRQAAALDICPYGPSSKDIEKFEPDWFEPAQYRIPVADKETVINVTRATEQSKVQCESLLAVVDAYYTAMRAMEDGSTTAAATFSNALQSNYDKFGNYMSTLAFNVGRRPFITENGYVGVGPGCMEKGDEVVVVLGASVPYVLRTESTGRRVILGDAYVHGVMDGECMEGSPTVEVFQLV